ncbi:alpha/beta hydrolase [Tateyamaria omphalii]|uniref:alpha/beta hydrolase n=1 Tax=Tateyamaria omphalii TaxID=299262 RepID=UPI001C99F58E|nr:alpha/beta hydrolase [Tateyamaria omphalii]MBY5935012.1 alpha/beta hydrolase [Tateyamaria omphalii]
MEKVTFDVKGTPLVGDLYKFEGKKRQPAVAIIGPMTYQKEQAPTEYAKRMADAGYTALAYDSRYRGESGGEPRAWENPAHKVADLKAAVAYLRSRDDVDPERVFILAICQGSSEAFRAAAELGNTVRGLATIAGHYRDRDRRPLPGQRGRYRVAYGRRLECAQGRRPGCEGKIRSDG